jgi:hypothetical protein
LSPVQLAQFDEHRYFDVVGCDTAKRYRINLLWGIFAALMRFVPCIGAFIAAAVPAALAIAVDPGQPFGPGYGGQLDFCFRHS